jgi:hypothetical protein
VQGGAVEARKCPLRSNRDRGEGTVQHGLRLSAVSFNFFPLYHFFCVTTSIFHPLLFRLPQRFPLNTFSIPHYNHKIRFSIPTFYPLSIFHLLIIYCGPTRQCQTV